MTLDELITDLKAAGANANTMQLAMNCYELGLKNATEVERKASAEHHLGIMRGAIAGAVAAEREACARIVEDAWTAFSHAPIFRLEVNPFPELKFAAKRIRARGNA